MRWSILGAWCLAATLVAGVGGCGGGAMDEGMPEGDLQPQVKMDPKMVDMSGASFASQKKAAAKNAAAAKAAPAPAPSGAEKTDNE